ncbi:DUF4136 domain-containing protein [Colwellia echini]|uniref:DUF4136 domain-containing protein n=1 Tax=Colwellia echini TaxID=1982103 RepID=A0ABY3N1R1_9GAMM|nr:DUF4136 domain-containing protein [Colwellia echini]
MFSVLITIIKSLVTCVLLFNIFACSSTSYETVYDGRFDFAQVKNYSFYNNDSDFFNSQSLDYAQRSRVELAIERSMNEQRFKYSKPEQADIIVTYHFVNKKYKDYLAYNKIVLFCSHCLRASTWISENQNWTVFSDALIIDLVDPKNHRSIWRSIYPLNYQVQDNSQKLNEKIINAVDTMLAQYPK